MTAGRGERRPLRRRLADAPVVQALGIALAAAAIQTYLQLAFGHDALRPERLLATLTVAAIVAVGFAVVLTRARRHPSRAPRGSEVAEAMDAGRLPDDADPAIWVSVLLRRREVLEQLGGGPALAVAAVILVGSVALSILGGPALVWTLPAAVALLVLGVRVGRQGALARVDALLVPLLDAAPAPAKRG